MVAVANRVERILERVKAVKLECVEGNTLTFRIVNDIERILHIVDFEGKQVGHFIKTKYNSWLPTLRELELLVDYFTFLRALCEVTCFPSKENKEKALNLAEQGEVEVTELCEVLYGDEWKDVLIALKTFTNR